MNSIPSPPSATLFTQSKNSNHLFKFNLKVPILPFHSSPSHLTTPCCTLRDSTSSVLDKNAPTSEQSSINYVPPKDSNFEGTLVVRRPVKESSGQNSDEKEEQDNYEIEEEEPKASSIDAGLTKFAKKMPMFEPGRVESDSEEIEEEEPKASSIDAGLTKFAKKMPMFEPGRVESDSEEIEEEEPKASSIDAGLTKFAKKMPMFEPGRVESDSEEKPLTVNLDLALYKAKVLTRNFRYEEAEKILQQCLCYWPEDGRPYVALGKVFSKQSKTSQAREVYEKGCQATQGENAYIWQCWAVLENRMGNVRRARKLFDAATVADKKHVAAWHGWAVLELKQGNIQKARSLLSKGLQYCGQNEYIYQTLALLEVKANRYQQARYLFNQATKCNPKSCASWLAWAQMEVEQENNRTARKLFENAVQASPKNRFAWHVWGVFEANLGKIEKGKKLLKIGHALNPRDAVLLQSLALIEYKHSSANRASVLFRRASELDPKHQPVWFAWGWMEWKEGNLNTARELYKKALSIDQNSESAARCLQAWGVLEQRVGDLSTARRLFRSSLNINSQSYVTWMTWASLEEDQGNSVRAEEIRNLYFQQRTEVVDDASWVMGFLDILDPAIDSLRRLLKMDPNSINMPPDSMRLKKDTVDYSSDSDDDDDMDDESEFDLDRFIMERLSLDVSKLEVQLETPKISSPNKILSPRRIWRAR